MAAALREQVQEVRIMDAPSACIDELEILLEDMVKAIALSWVSSRYAPNGDKAQAGREAVSLSASALLAEAPRISSAACQGTSGDGACATETRRVDGALRLW